MGISRLVLAALCGASLVGCGSSTTSTGTTAASSGAAGSTTGSPVTGTSSGAASTTSTTSATSSAGSSSSASTTGTTASSTTAASTASSTSTTTSTTSSTGTSGSGCNPVAGTNAATYVSQNIPTSVIAGASFTVTVTMMNSGTTTWAQFPSQGYYLGSQSPMDNGTWGTNRGFMDAGTCVAPGQSVTITVNLTAPTTPGSYTMQWQMLQDAVEWFGDMTPLSNITVSQPVFPTVPTRDQVLGIKLQFQGLTVQTVQYGELPWFEAALAWLTPADRQSVYAAKHAVGDTHCIIALPSGSALYDEPNQPYSADRFGPLDWTAQNTAMDPQFVALVEEVILNGFTPLIFLGGDDGENGFPVAMAQLPLVTNALAASQYGDLNLYVVKIPGWDGVFYGYTPQHVQDYSDLARQLSPNGYVGIEHNTGHIPVGNGPGDYAIGGMMENFDLILGEFDDGTAIQGGANDSVWQIVGRMVSPYNRPPDQPAGDDPSPPFYLAQPSARGPFYYGCFEFEEYSWVHNWYGLDAAGIAAAAAQIAQERAYLTALGCAHTG